MLSSITWGKNVNLKKFHDKLSLGVFHAGCGKSHTQLLSTFLSFSRLDFLSKIMEAYMQIIEEAKALGCWPGNTCSKSIDAWDLFHLCLLLELQRSLETNESAKTSLITEKEKLVSSYLYFLSVRQGMVSLVISPRSNTHATSHSYKYWKAGQKWNKWKTSLASFYDRTVGGLVFVRRIPISACIHTQETLDFQVEWTLFVSTYLIIMPNHEVDLFHLSANANRWDDEVKWEELTTDDYVIQWAARKK